MKTQKRSSMSIPTWIIVSLILTVSLICFSSCGGGGGGGGGSDEPVTKKWTVLAYIASDNDLNDNDDWAYYDFKEMEKVGTTSDVNIIVQWDRDDSDPTGYVNWSGCRRYKVTQDSDGEGEIVSQMLSDLGEVDSGDPDTFVSFVKWGVKNYPADKYCIVMWNHGSGWWDVGYNRSAKNQAMGICWDDTSGTVIKTSDIGPAFGKISDYIGSPVDLVYMNACLQGGVEVAYEMYGSVDYTVLSAESMWVDAFPFDTVLGDLTENPNIGGKTLGGVMCDRFQETCEQKGYTDQILANVRVDDLEQLATACGNFADAVRGITTNDDLTALETLMNKTTYMRMGYPTDGVYYRDLGDLVNGVLQDATLTASVDVETQNALDYAQDIYDILTDRVVVDLYKGNDYSKVFGLTAWMLNTKDAINEYALYSSEYQTDQWEQDTRWGAYFLNTINNI